MERKLISKTDFYNSLGYSYNKEMYKKYQKTQNYFPPAGYLCHWTSWLCRAVFEFLLITGDLDIHPLWRWDIHGELFRWSWFQPTVCNRQSSIRIPVGNWWSSSSIHYEYEIFMVNSSNLIFNPPCVIDYVRE